MSHVTGLIRRKVGKKTTTVKIDHKTDKKHKLHPEFMEEYRNLLKKYGIPVKKARSAPKKKKQ